MNMDKQNDNRTDLSKALHAWTVKTPLPSRFQNRVWQRIEKQEPIAGVTLWNLFRGWLETKVMRPAVAFSYVVVLLFAGLTVGFWQAHADTSKAQSVWQTRYVQSVDPYQANH